MQSSTLANCWRAASAAAFISMRCCCNQPTSRLADSRREQMSWYLSASLLYIWPCLWPAESCAARSWCRDSSSKASRSARCLRTSSSMRSSLATRCCVSRAISSVCARICSSRRLLVSLPVPRDWTSSSFASACRIMSPLRLSHRRCASCRDCRSTSPRCGEPGAAPWLGPPAVRASRASASRTRVMSRTQRASASPPSCRAPVMLPSCSQHESMTRRSL
mmetsp:Transcript_70408/g.209913  ORF Transcript_70408/g.209913 Transcript_70408/m.209913 type:complete len:220 (-) Transcript_70408:175-834(-)